MQRQSFKTNYLQTICWVGNSLVDWASAGMQYMLDGSNHQLHKYTFSFGDAAITSSDGNYAFIYQRLGTKGLLLKNGNLLREINRSYYCADIYEYPAAFITIHNKTFLVHCPLKYCRLDFEDVETGQVVTDHPDRNPSDFFHSRLEVCPNNTYFLSKGWFWHPRDDIQLYKIEDCFHNPTLLDNPQFYPNVGTELFTATFIDNKNILIGSSSEEAMNEELADILPPNHIAVWNIESNTISDPVKVKTEFGNLFAINEKYAWDTFKFPKIISIVTGEVIDKDETIACGNQNSSIIPLNLPKITFNTTTKQLAISNGDGIEVIEKQA